MSKREKRKHHGQKYCRITGKQRYKSRAYATEVMDRIIEMHGETGLVVYECIYCGAFHIGHEQNRTCNEESKIEI